MRTSRLRPRLPASPALRADLSPSLWIDRLQRYGMAILAVAVAVGMERAYVAIFETAPMLLMFGAILVAAWVGGLGPGLVATASSLLAVHAWIIPGRMFEPDRLGAEGVRGLLFVAIGAGISLIIDRFHRLLARTDAQHRELGLLHRAAVQLGATLDPGQVYATLAELLAERIDCDGLIVSAFDSESRMIRCQFARLDGQPLDPTSFPPIPLNEQGEGMQSPVILSGRSRLIDDVEAVTRRPGSHYVHVDHDQVARDAPTSEQRRMRSTMLVPLVLERRVLGLVQVMSYRRAAYRPDDLQLFEMLVTQLAASTRNAYLYTQAQDEVTERRSAEHALRELATSLDQRVRARTVELQRKTDELQVKQGELQARNDQLLDFSYTMSHDLQGPLRAIRAYVDLLRDEHGGTLPDDAREYFDRVGRSVEDMHQLIRDLLEYHRLSSVQLVHEAVGVTEAVGAAVRASANEFAERGAAVEMRIDPALPPVRAHAASLAQVVWNLLVNGAKFVAPGVAPRIVVQAEQAGDTVRLWVEDNGIGIAPEHRERIFRVFERLHSTSDYPGTGMGLAMARRAVERMGGRLDVESQPGHGSRFWLELPIATPASLANPQPSETASV